MNKEELINAIDAKLSLSGFVTGTSKTPYSKHIYMMMDGCRYHIMCERGEYDMEYIPEMVMIDTKFYLDKPVEVSTGSEVVSLWD